MEEMIQKIANTFKVFGDKTRVRILLLLQDGELCVDEIVVKTNMEQSAISHQLRILKEAHLIKSRKVSRFSYYSLDDDHVSTILKMGMEHIVEECNCRRKDEKEI